MTTDSFGRSLDQAEDALLDAMRGSDVERLAELLSRELAFCLPDGAIISRDDDLEAHRTGTTRFLSITERSRSTIAHAGRGRTQSLVDVALIDHGTPIEATLRYERYWSVIGGRWQVIAGSESVAD